MLTTVTMMHVLEMYVLLLLGSSDFHDWDDEEGVRPELAFASCYPVLSATKGRHTYTRSKYIEKAPPPRTIYYGTSHIGRLCRWKSDILAECGPNDIEQHLLKDSKFVYSGGSKWYNIHSRVQGKGVPDWQKQGNTWQRVLCDIENGYVPEYVVVCCMANELCEWNDKYYEEIRYSDQWHLLIDSPYGPSDYYKTRKNAWFDDRVEPVKNPKSLNIERFMKGCKKVITGNIDKVMKILKCQFGDCKFFYIGAINRIHWFPAIMNMILFTNKYMRDVHGMQLCLINRYLRWKHMERNAVHLNREGYKLLLSKGMGPFVDWHINKYVEVEEKRPIESRSKSARKRLYARIRRSNERMSKYKKS